MTLALRHLSRIFRPENVFTIIATVSEMQALTGFSPSGLIAFRSQRLVVRELLIRVAAHLRSRWRLTCLSARHVDRRRGERSRTRSAQPRVNATYVSTAARIFAPRTVPRGPPRARLSPRSFVCGRPITTMRATKLQLFVSWTKSSDGCPFACW